MNLLERIVATVRGYGSPKPLGPGMIPPTAEIPRVPEPGDVMSVQRIDPRPRHIDPGAVFAPKPAPREQSPRLSAPCVAQVLIPEGAVLEARRLPAAGGWCPWEVQTEPGTQAVQFRFADAPKTKWDPAATQALK